MYQGHDAKGLEKHQREVLVIAIALENEYEGHDAKGLGKHSYSRYSQLIRLTKDSPYEGSAGGIGSNYCSSGSIITVLADTNGSAISAISVISAAQSICTCIRSSSSCGWNDTIGASTCILTLN